MKTKATRPAKAQSSVRFCGETLDFDGIMKRMAERQEQFRKMPLAKQRAELIRQGTLTPEGKLPVYPMDHVPLGPRE